MCGIVGIAGLLAHKDDATMKRLFLLDYFRGPDSTGLAAIRTSGDIKLSKINSHPLDLFEMSKFKDALSAHQTKAYIGHNRSATRGLVNTFNAHPFHFDHIIGVHNGTLDNSSHSAIEKALDEKFPVDSQAVIASIAKLGIDETMKMMSGAWSLVWYDQNEDTLNFLRNKERPMWYAYNKACDQLFYASEWPMIDSAVKLSGQYELYQDPEKGHRFWATEEDVHYAYDLKVLRAGSAERPKPKARVLKGKEPTPVVATAGHDPFNRGSRLGSGGVQWPSNQTGSTHSSTTTSLGTNVPRTLLHLVGDIKAPFAGYIDEEKFNALAKYGCSWCQTDIEFGEQGVLIYERDDIIICPTCAAGDKDGKGQTKIYVKTLDGLV